MESAGTFLAQSTVRTKMIEITTYNNCHWWCYTEDGMLEALVPT